MVTSGGCSDSSLIWRRLSPTGLLVWSQKLNSVSNTGSQSFITACVAEHGWGGGVGGVCGVREVPEATSCLMITT